MTPMITPHQAVVKAVASALRGRCGVPRGARVLVAVSGGPDSVALLRVMEFLSRRRAWGLGVCVGHVQHHLRAAAEGDARFVAELCETLGVEYSRCDVDLSQSRGNLEATARRARYEALASMAEEAGAGWVVVGHHGDDQLETLLMRLMRGSSARGLAGMAWRRRVTRGSAIQLVRPMLGVDRLAVAEFLRSIDQAWRADRSNEDTTRLRARLRHEVLPILHAIAPGVASKAVGMADQFRKLQQVVDSQAEIAAAAVVPGDDPLAFDRDKARGLAGEGLVLTALLRAKLMEAGVGGDSLGGKCIRPIVRAILDTQGGVRSFDLAGGVRVEIDRERARIVRAG